MGHRDNQDGVSRRQLLRNAIVAAGSAAALAASVSQAQAKMTQKGAGYQDTPKGQQSCANCSLFTAPASCILVEGAISPDGWCRFYAKKS